MFSELINITNEYVKKIDIFNSEFEEIQKKIKNIEPASLRKQYERFMNVIDAKKQEMNDAENVLNKSIEILNNGKEKIHKINKLLEKITILSNKLKTGTLHGLTKGVIASKKIKPKKGDEIAQNVLDFSKIYNEIDHIHISKGGKKRRTNKKKSIYKNKRRTNKSI